jgi:hypothetical protein
MESTSQATWYSIVSLSFFITHRYTNYCTSPYCIQAHTVQVPTVQVHTVQVHTVQILRVTPHAYKRACFL